MEYNVITKREYVYVLSNPSFDNNIFKIGWSRKHPIIRANNLYTSGVPTPFVIEFVISTDDGMKLENKIHNHLDQFRINKKREFFKITKEQIYTIIKDDLNLELLDNNLHFEDEITSIKVDNRFETTTKINFKCEKCNKFYKSRVGLWKHKKQCKEINNNIKSSTSTQKLINEITPEFILSVLEQNNTVIEQNNTVIEQTKKVIEQTKTIIELSKNV